MAALDIIQEGVSEGFDRGKILPEAPECGDLKVGREPVVEGTLFQN